MLIETHFLHKNTTHCYSYGKLLSFLAITYKPDFNFQFSKEVTYMSLVGRVRVIVFNVTFNNILLILCQSVLLVEETVAPGENH